MMKKKKETVWDKEEKNQAKGEGVRKTEIVRKKMRLRLLMRLPQYVRVCMCLCLRERGRKRQCEKEREREKEGTDKAEKEASVCKRDVGKTDVPEFVVAYGDHDVIRHCRLRHRQTCALIPLKTHARELPPTFSDALPPPLPTSSDSIRLRLRRRCCC